MTGMKTTKRSTLFSVIAIALCFVLLFGATWAWFSATVLNADNTIGTGTFAVDLEMKNGDAWASIAGDEAAFECNGWMPGDSVAKVMRVANEGDIAMDWSAAFVADYTVADGAKDLAEVINVYYIAYDADETTYSTDITGLTAIGTLAQCMANNGLAATVNGADLAANATQAFAIVLVMDTTAGSEYQDLTATFDIQISAIQANAN